ncbi:MAG: SRPBCC domain-containing protein [Acidobacteria bacterium]|nr:SRPBCC domain-containing protein [Acidobacteriota bacterium]
MCKTIKQTVTFRAEPAEVYKHLVSDSDAVGQRFRMGEGSGIVVDMAPDTRVVRAWREGDYPEGVFSMAAFTLRPVNTGTELTLTHRGVPKALIPRTEERWRRDYWDPIKQELGQRPARRAGPTPGAGGRVGPPRSTDR